MVETTKEKEKVSGFIFHVHYLKGGKVFFGSLFKVTDCQVVRAGISVTWSVT